jgi:REP element-mobilizing transposase RayT
MAKPVRIEYKGAVYHVTARGNGRSRILFSRKDYARFKEYLGETKEKYSES